MNQKLIYPFLGVYFCLLLSACSEQPKTAPAPEEKSKPAWSYEGKTGPDYWGELDPAYAACANGKEQSPINIEFSHVTAGKASDDIQVHYEPTNFSLLNNGHTIQATPDADTNHITVDGKEYKLIQFHFHTPSEHQFNGRSYHMEMHLVHQGENGELAVLGVMIKEGDKNNVLAPLWDTLPTEKEKKAIALSDSVDIESLLPENQTAFHYSGSLTTPSCTEDVNWSVFGQPIKMSKQQIKTFQEIFPDNHRPVQPQEEREIRKY